MQTVSIHNHSILDQYFTPDTMSIHFKSGCQMMSKIGKPGHIEYIESEEIRDDEKIRYIRQSLLDEIAYSQGTARLEIDRKYSKVMQVGPYRVVIVDSPLADAIEITVVRPVRRLSMSDYEKMRSHDISFSKFEELISSDQRGILISGSPGSGKSTFTQALAELYISRSYITKTIESPRDLLVDDRVVQYSFNYAPHSEIRDILLLSRPDVAIYDEVRNIEDFVLFKDLRLTGIGLVGVIHATKAIDSIQRFVGTISLGMIAQVVDTVIYISQGNISEVLQLSQIVKVPAGMNSSDLARPVIVVSSFLTSKPMYEMYSYGEQIVVVAIDSIEGKNMQDNLILTMASKGLQSYIDEYYGFSTRVVATGASSMDIYISSSHKGEVIGKSGANIQKLEKELGVSISVHIDESLDDSFGNINKGFKSNNRSQRRKRGRR